MIIGKGNMQLMFCQINNAGSIINNSRFRYMSTTNVQNEILILLKISAFKIRLMINQ